MTFGKFGIAVACVALALGGCVDSGRGTGGMSSFLTAYAPSGAGGKYARTVVANPTGERPGTIVVNTRERYLYYVRDDGKAWRYGVGVGREGFGWKGRAVVGRKAEWPTWTPPAAMMKRDPRTRQFAGGMPGGPNNPLGARAMYLHSGGRDTMYRIHGTNDPSSIGRAMSSGCIRMANPDVMHLYGQVKPGTRVVVL